MTHIIRRWCGTPGSSSSTHTPSPPLRGRMLPPHRRTLTNQVCHVYALMLKKSWIPSLMLFTSNNCASRSYSRMPYARQQAAPLARPAPPPASRRTIYSCRPPAPLHRYLLRTLGLLPSCLRPAAVVSPPTRRGRAVSCLTARLQQWGAGPCTAAAVWGTLARY